MRLLLNALCDIISFNALGSAYLHASPSNLFLNNNFRPFPPDLLGTINKPNDNLHKYKNNILIKKFIYKEKWQKN